MLPLCYVDQKYLSFSSTLCILANIYLFCLVLYAAFAPSAREPSQELDFHDICWLGFTKGSVAMFSNLMMAMMIQPCVLPTYASLEERSVPKFRRALIIAF